MAVYSRKRPSEDALVGILCSSVRSSNYAGSVPLNDCSNSDPVVPVVVKKSRRPSCDQMGESSSLASNVNLDGLNWDSSRSHKILIGRCPPRLA